MKQDKKVKAPQQYLSYDYGKFQFVGANRQLSEHHVSEVMEEITNKDPPINDITIKRTKDITNANIKNFERAGVSLEQ